LCVASPHSAGKVAGSQAAAGAARQAVAWERGL
jgi:hypothetical protein